MIRRTRDRRDRGSATVLVLAVVATGLVAMVLLGGLVHASLARGTAQAAADLAAIAAAREATRGAPDPCRIAAEVAERNGADLASCIVGDGALVDVRVDVPAEPLPGWSRAATAEARAGPVGMG
ncbi:flp pilus-assembly TadE/G-like family protein [Ruania alkalisoli]|uniref:Flp pilus-assembly TadE/G-like family protein n=1 Tax=Ruania alkalisoli TaxID=2779775 RepID=A0A7M1SX97_9MICO|nr:Rv3654c family TadE-like protein [Ruania alkalisoli]QOR71352.1 flp pilus-assembly TadE/G-like family protein [Ruania alkalisoli]